MFDFKKDYRFAWPVTVLVPTLDGQVEKKFTGIFRLVPDKELREAIAAESGNDDAVVARLTLCGWKDDLTSDGKPFAYSEAARDEVIELPFMRFGIARGYWSAISGALREKN